MEKEIGPLIKSQKYTELSSKLKDVPFEEIDKLIDSHALRSKGETVPLVRGLLHGSSPNTVHTCERRLHIFHHCINLLQGNRLSSSKIASELVGVLMMETDGFPARCLAELASIYTEAIKNGRGANEKSLELFPKILSAISVQEAVVFAGKDMSGPDYKSHILNSLCSGRWDPGIVIHLAAMFKDVPMTQDELQFVIKKLLRLLGELDLQELPPLVYQLLLLASKGHKKIVLDGVISFFEKKDKQLKEQNIRQFDELSEMADDGTQVRFVEGTIILHITFAMKQDQDLGREFVKCLKASQQCSVSKVMAPFNLALALSTARIHRFEEQVFDILKGTILKSFKELEKQKQSRFMKDMTPDSFGLVEFIQDTITNSKSGWDHVTQGLVQLGFTLMDSYGPKSAFGRVSEGLPTSQKTPTQKACDLGATILLQTFKAHEIVRGEILEQILNRVVTKATAPVSHIMALLSNTVKAAPQSLVDCLPKVREALDYLSYLPPLTGNALLKAIHPLLKIRMSLKDSLVLVLRKAMFSKQLEARKIAVSGFLLILENFKVLGGMPSSQSASQSSASSSGQPNVSVDIHTPYNTATNEALCLEILGNLRRCLQQQAEVRLTLYEGLYDVLCKNTQLGLPMLGMLLSQFSKCYEKVEDINPPIKLEPCVTTQGDQVILNEPLPHLLSCLVQCLFKTNEIRAQRCGLDDDEEDDDVHLRVEKILQSLTLRMVKCEMEDFELDKSADFSGATSVGRKNSLLLGLVMGTYEVLIEYNFIKANFDPAAIQQVLELFKIYQKLADIAKEKVTGSLTGGVGGSGKDRKGKGRGATSASASNAKNASKSLMTIKCVTQLTKAIFIDEIPRHQEAAQQMRQNVDFIKYVVTVAQQKIQQVSDRGTCDGAEGHNQKSIFNYISQLARIMLQTYDKNLEIGDDGLPGKARTIYPLCLEGFAAVTSTICSRYPLNLTDFVKAIDFTGQGVIEFNRLSTEDLLHEQIKRFQRMMLGVITSKDDDRSPKEALQFLSVISQLCNNLQPGGHQITQVYTWIQKVCLEQKVDDTSVVRSLLSLLFTLTVQEKSVLALLGDLARDIHCQLGDIDQEVELPKGSKYLIVTERSAASTILLPVMAQMDRELEDTEWILNKLKAEPNLLYSTDSVSPGPTQRESQAKTLISRLGHIVNVFHEVSQSVLPVGTCIDTVIKVLTRLYGTLGLITKYYISMYTQKSGHIPPRFEKLVKLTGTHLTQYVYAMITYIQASQNEHLQAANEKTKDKDKKITTAVALAAKAKVMKEGRAIPNLIYAIEQYEKFLITLSRKSKVNLMEHMKNSTSRDFRIDVDSLKAALQEQASSDEEEDDEPDSTMETNEAGAEETKEARAEANSDNGARENSDNTSSSSSDSEDEQENVAPPRKKAKLSTTTSSDSDSRLSKSRESNGKGKKSKALSARSDND